MITVSVCAECGGKGSYKIYNIYDPEFEEEVICEHCDGLGVPTTLEHFPVRKQTPKNDSWVN